MVNIRTGGLPNDGVVIRVLRQPADIGDFCRVGAGWVSTSTQYTEHSSFSTIPLGICTWYRKSGRTMVNVDRS